MTLLFRARVVGGVITLSEETQEVAFLPLTPVNLSDYVTRPAYYIRSLDALTNTTATYEAFHHQPYECLIRLGKPEE